MLALWSAAGIVADASAIPTGPVDAPKERIAIAPRLQPATPSGAGIPYGAATWAWPFDPADYLPYVFSFESAMDTNESIATVERIAISSAGAALGLMIDQGSNHPVIDEAGKRRIQLWFSVDPAMQTSLPFDAGGALIPISFRVLTDKAHRLDRTAVLMVRQQ